MNQLEPPVDANDPCDDNTPDCKVWQDQAAAMRPNFTGTLGECKTFVRSNPLLGDLFIELPNGDQFAWNPHTKGWDWL